MSHFFAYLSRMKFIKRWGLMHTTYPENIQEHSLRVAMIAHALALIRNERFGGSVNPDRTASLAMYHDAAEVLIGDLPSPVKYYNKEILNAYKQIETVSQKKLLSMLPEELRGAYEFLLVGHSEDEEERKLVAAADKVCAYVKCLEEVSAGNPEFKQARHALERQIRNLNMPEVAYFLEKFAPSFELTLDELH